MTMTKAGSAPAATLSHFPLRQLVILSLVRISEPIALMSIFPYIYYMVQSFEITKDESTVAFYAGAVTSAFTFAEFSTGLFWGRISDKIGRKPVLLGGLAGTGLSMVLFGFSTNLPMALIARAVGGILNGNIGVIQTTVAELVPQKEYEHRTYSIMPFIWCLGSILGPALGGALAQPCQGLWSCQDASLWSRYPFLLTNLTIAVITVIGLLVGILFLEETHEKIKNRRDVGVDWGNWILSGCTSSTDNFDDGSRTEEVKDYEDCALLHDSGQAPAYGNTPTLVEHGPVGKADSLSCEGANQGEIEGRKKGGVFTKQVVLQIVAYGILAYHTMVFEQFFPVLLSTPSAPNKRASLFWFTGGFSMSTSSIGLMLTIASVYSILPQLILQPLVVKRFGSLAAFRFVALCYPLLNFCMPYATLLPTSLQMPVLYLFLAVKTTIATVAYPANAILMRNASPSNLVLGRINGAAASVASLARAIGPMLAGLIYSAGIKIGMAGLAWWVSAAICLLGAIQTYWMSEEIS